MSYFKLSNNTEELKAHIQQYIDISEESCAIYKIFKMEVVDASYEENWIEYKHICTEFEKNRYGNVHGAAITTLLDTAMGLAAFELGTGNASPTMDLNIRFIKGVKIGEEITVRAEVISVAKHNAVLRAVMRCGDEIRAIASGTNRLYTSTIPDTLPFAK